MAFIDQNKDDVLDGRRLGVEPICRVLQVASSTYYAAKNRTPSARALRDAELIPQLVAIWEDNYRVYGVRKLWKAARRAGIMIGRDQTARLMRAAGIEGASRSKRVRTTLPDPAASRHPDLVRREFTATAPNRLWVTDLTFVPTWAGVAYVCFIIDAFSRMIVGWRVASHMRTEMVLDAIEMARWSRGHHHDDLRCHSDAGAQGGFKWSSQHHCLGLIVAGRRRPTRGVREHVLCCPRRPQPAGRNQIAQVSNKLRALHCTGLTRRPLRSSVR